jgi:DNA polymerase III delta prime subunit
MVFLPSDHKFRYKLVIMDEIDSMTSDAQSMLRNLIEKSSGSTKFCLICNNIDDINPSLQSRCTIYRFPPIIVNDMFNHLNNIVNMENINIKEKVILKICELSKGDMRSGINMLQKLNFLKLNGEITMDIVLHASGFPSTKINKKILNILFKSKDNNICDTITELHNIVVDNNISLDSLLVLITEGLLDSKLNDNIKMELLINLAKQEIYDTINVEINVILSAIVGHFYSI